MSKYECVRIVAGVFVGIALATGCVTVSEKKVGLDQVPPAVKAAIEKEMAGGTLKEIETEGRCGKTTYEVEYVKDGRKVEVKFAEDGNVMTCGGHGDKCKCEKCASK